MKKYRIQKSSFAGTLSLPPSKSQTLRSLVFALLASGKSTLHNYLPSPDTDAMIHAITAFGADVTRHATHLDVVGVGGKLKSPENVIDAGNSGLVLRLIGGISSLISTYVVITGDESIRTRRVVSPLLDGLTQAHVFAQSLCLNGKAPLIIKGPHLGGAIKVEGEDSQPISGLILGSVFAQNPTHLHVKNPGEKPWIDLTCHWLDFLSLPYKREGYTDFYFPGKGTCTAFDYTIPSDLSTLAFPVVAALITESEITISGVDWADIQGDKKFIEILIQMGAKIEINKPLKTVRVYRSPTLKGVSIDINDFIDALPIFAVLGCFAKGTTELKNGTMARNKECNRIQAIVCELKKMGAKIEETADGLMVHPSSLKGATVSSYGDHRMGMSLAVAAMRAEGETTIVGTECIKKTYPHFYEDFKSLGINLKEEK